MSERKTPEQWAELDGLTIYDPDGWRMDDAPPFDAPIDRDEYLWRMRMSTIIPHAAAPVAPKVCPTCSDLRVLVGPNPDHDPLDRRSPTDLVVPCPSCSAEKGAGT